LQNNDRKSGRVEQGALRVAVTNSEQDRRPAQGGGFSLQNEAVRAIFWQILVLGIVGLGVWYLVSNTMTNLEARRIASGFGFLGREAGLPIGEAMIAYAPTDSYQRALFVGLLNTLKVAVVGIVLATVLGTLIGIARLSKNWLLAKIASTYVEVVRNTPLLLQLFLWYTLLQGLPGPRQAIRFGEGLFLSNRGIKVPWPVWDDLHLFVVGALVAGIIGAIVYTRTANAKQAATGKRPPVLLPNIGLIVLLPIVVWLALGAPLVWDTPVLRGFNFVGGATLTPEFAALTIGLVVYTAAFIAEIVRAGILAVAKGQWEAAQALGLHNDRVLNLIILPQALRVIIPPMTSQYLNVTKNSSLAVAIGYPDIVSVANTTLNQTGQAIEGIAIIMAAYLTVSLSISFFMNWYNKRIALVER
jgi:general L-amino acid transport system permease protein